MEPLAARIEISLPDLPERWLPSIHLYDADLPLFPTHYIHVVHPTTGRPAPTERTFGYIERMSVSSAGARSAVVVCNKTAEQLGHDGSLQLTNEVKERLGLNASVTAADIHTAFGAPMLAANPFLAELWERVVSNHHGGKLPFGRLWDEVLGLARWVASWNSPSGRKGELIQTHYFAKAFGERIQSAGTVPQVDYFLLPTISELLDPANSLALFPSFSRLLALAEAFQSSFCVLHTVAGITLSRFKNPGTGQFDGEKLQNLFRQLSPSLTPSGIECYNAFNREPGRTTCFLMMLADLRAGRFSPAAITPVQFGLLQDGLEKTYFYPKALQIYAQQSWGNSGAMPADTWITGFMSRTLQAPRTGNRGQYVDWPAVFGACSRLGKVERLLWVASQARKVHSSACDDALWCLKIASNRVERGPNPLSCAICSPSIVGKCPAFAAISGLTVRFNANSPTGAAFEIQTSAGNNTTAGQGFVRSTTLEPLTVARDDFSPIDRPHGYQTFPNPAHGGAPITVAQFQQFYRK